MSEEKQAEETEKASAADLSSLAGLDFGPAWAKSTPGNPYAGREDWPDEREVRGGRGNRGPVGRQREDRRGGGSRFGERREREGGRRFDGSAPRRHREDGGQGDRPPRNRGFAGRGDGEPRRDGPRPERGERPERGRGDRDRRAPRERVERMKVQISFLPDRERLMLVVRDIQVSRRAFPLMEIASRFVAQEDSCVLKLERPSGGEGEARPVFWQCRECKRVFCHKENAEAHVLNEHLDLFFTKEEQLAEPPSGTFNCVARCGLSGELLGPPNYHGYNERLQELWSTRFSHIPKADYLAKIEILHDEALLEEWKEQVRHQTVYRLKPETPPAKAAPETASAAEAAPVAEEASAAPESPEAPEVPETPAPEAEAAPEAASPAPETPAPEAAEPAPETPAMTRREAQEWIRTHRSQRMLRESGRCMLPATQSHKWDDISLRSAVDAARFREKQFPFTLSLALRPAFRHMRLHLFKINARETYVTAVQPKAFDEANAAPVDREIVAYLREHELPTRLNVLEALRPGESAESPAGSDVLLHLDGLIAQGTVLVLNTGALFLPRLGAPDETKETKGTEGTEAAEAAPEAETPAADSTAEAEASAEPAASPAAEAPETPEVPDTPDTPAEEPPAVPEPEPAPAAEPASEPAPESAPAAVEPPATEGDAAQ